MLACRVRLRFIDRTRNAENDYVQSSPPETNAVLLQQIDTRLPVVFDEGEQGHRRHRLTHVVCPHLLLPR